jgi:hypothetical protein
MDHKIVPIRFDMKMYNEIRDIAHINKVSMATLVRSGIEMLLESQRKILTKRDIEI